jgi:hypothetical protein
MLSATFQFGDDQDPDAPENTVTAETLGGLIDATSRRFPDWGDIRIRRGTDDYGRPFFILWVSGPGPVYPDVAGASIKTA